MNVWKRATLALSAAIALSLAGTARAQDGDTLKKIKATQTITIGYRDASSPFSYVGEKGQAVGYSVDLCLRIVDTVRATLQSPGIAVKWQAVSGASRIPLVANGTVDLECGSTTNTIERQQQVSFLVTTFVAATRFAMKRSANFRSLDDLKGKTVTAVAGTTNLRHITALNTKRALGMTIVPAKDNKAAFAMVEKGTAVAFATDDILLYDMVANSAALGDYAVVGDPLSIEPYGIMVRKDDAAFKQVGDDALRAVQVGRDPEALRQMVPVADRTQEHRSECAGQRGAEEGVRRADRLRVGRHVFRRRVFQIGTPGSPPRRPERPGGDR